MRRIITTVLLGFVSTSFGAVTVDSVNLHADSLVPHNWSIFDYDWNFHGYITESKTLDIDTPVTTSKYIYNNGHSNNGQLEGVPNTGLIDPITFGQDYPNVIAYGLPNGNFAVNSSNSWSEAGISLDVSNGIYVHAFQNVYLDSSLAPSNLSIDVRFTVTGAGAILNFHEQWYWYSGNPFYITDPTTGAVLLDSTQYSVGSFYGNDNFEDRLYFLDDYFLAPGTYGFSTTFNPDNEYVANQWATLSVVPVPEVGSVLLSGLTCGLIVLAKRRTRPYLD